MFIFVSNNLQTISLALKQTKKPPHTLPSIIFFLSSPLQGGEKDSGLLQCWVLCAAAGLLAAPWACAAGQEQQTAQLYFPHSFLYSCRPLFHPAAAFLRVVESLKPAVVVGIMLGNIIEI